MGFWDFAGILVVVWLIYASLKDDRKWRRNCATAKRVREAAKPAPRRQADGKASPHRASSAPRA